MDVESFRQWLDNDIQDIYLPEDIQKKISPGLLQQIRSLCWKKELRMMREEMWTILWSSWENIMDCFFP